MLRRLVGRGPEAGRGVFTVTMLCCSMGWIHKGHHISPTKQHWQTEVSSKDAYFIMDSENSIWKMHQSWQRLPP